MTIAIVRNEQKQGDSWKADAINRELPAVWLPGMNPHINDKMVPFSLENFFDEAVIIINSIKSQPLGTGILKQTDKIRILHAAIK